MLLRSLWRLESVDIGFTPPGALTARLAIDPSEYNEARSAVFFEQLIHRLEAVPGAQSVGASGWLPVVDMGAGAWVFCGAWFLRDGATARASKATNRSRFHSKSHQDTSRRSAFGSLPGGNLRGPIARVRLTSRS